MRAKLERELRDLDATIEAERASAPRAAGAGSLPRHPRVRARTRPEPGLELAEHEAALNQIIATRTAFRGASLPPRDAQRPLPPEPPRAHIRRPHRPYAEPQQRRTRFLRFWAVISTPLLLGSTIVLLIGSPLAWIVEIAILICVFVGVEAIARRRFLSLVASVILLVGSLALGAGLVLLFLKHWRTALAVLVGVAALALLLGNLRAARRR